MNIKQLNTALTLAQSDADLSAHDSTIMHGFALRDFKPVIVTIEQVAKLIRWQCIQLSGGIDSDALLEIASCGRHKFTVIGRGA